MATVTNHPARGNHTLVALAVGAVLVALELQQALDGLLVLSGSIVRPARHGGREGECWCRSKWLRHGREDDDTRWWVMQIGGQECSEGAVHAQILEH